MTVWLTAVALTSLAVAAVPLAAGSEDSATRRAGYAALGDSVAAGFGLRPGSQTTKQDRLCKRSSRAYPFRVAGRLDARLRSFVACSGATFDDGLYGQQDVGDVEMPEQIERVFSRRTPRLMSITIGANDMRWSYFVAKCYVSRCGTDTDKDLFWLLKQDLRYEQWRMRTEVEFRAWQNDTRKPRSALTGYYDPFGPKRCRASHGVSKAEKHWVQSKVHAINDELRHAAGEESWLRYAGVNRAFKGHRLCSGKSWIRGPRTKGMLHPTRLGQRAYARAVARDLH
ncbi:MAG TPA: SGNH/GDSL hydrolase family protein [Nocardioidaceae bacterium]|nr:SGNH/GDSL hydrolase family protein [Nocardioidaceae bacterium]